MKTFLGIGTHDPLPPEVGREVATASLPWIADRLAEGSIDALYAMKGGGRMIIASALDEESLMVVLATAPDAEIRSWKITELIDGITAINEYLAAN